MPRCKFDTSILCHYSSCDDRCPVFRRTGQSRLFPMTNHVMTKNTRKGKHIGIPRPDNIGKIVEVIERKGEKITRWKVKK